MDIDFDAENSITRRITPLISHELEKTFKTRLVRSWISKPDLVDLLEEIDSFRNETSSPSTFWFQWQIAEIVSDNWTSISPSFLLQIEIFQAKKIAIRTLKSSISSFFFDLNAVHEHFYNFRERESKICFKVFELSWKFIVTASRQT